MKRMGEQLLDDYFQMQRYMEIRDKVSSIKLLKMLLLEQTQL